MSNNSVERLYGFDILRFLMVLCVIMLHSAMTYMAFVPQWWYVIDPRNSLAFTVLVVFLDSFPMSVLFFLAGYFAPPSLGSRGRRGFLAQKFLRIVLPWLVGLVFVAPFFAYATFLAFNIPCSGPMDFISHHFFGPFYQQGHYWFLGVLMAFLILFGLFGGTGRRERPGIPVLRILAVLGATALGYGLSCRFLMPPDDWLNIGFILYFQPARIVGYAALFLLGASAWREGWLSAGHSATPWGLLTAVFSVALLLWRFLPPSVPADLRLSVDAVLYSGTSTFMTIFLPLLLAPMGEPASSLKSLTAASYGIYWLHQILLMPFLWLMLGWEIPIALKWLLSLPFTVGGGWLIYRAAHKAFPALKRII